MTQIRYVLEWEILCSTAYLLDRLQLQEMLEQRSPRRWVLFMVYLLLSLTLAMVTNDAGPSISIVLRPPFSIRAFLFGRPEHMRVLHDAMIQSTCD
ncbi:hypothetical protein OSTOST_15174 [Ostertagia ostertagi]